MNNNSTNENGRAVLLLNGVNDLPLKDVRDLVASSNLFICTDGAARYALKRDLIPDVVIGDLDSITPEDLVRARSEDAQIVKLPEQESGDCEKALRWLLANGIDQVVVLGHGGGGRQDHTLTNYSVLMRYASKFPVFMAYDLNHKIQFMHMPGEIRLRGWAGRRVSLIPYPISLRVTLRGFLYPLNDEDLMLGVREGLSNRMLSDEASISMASGAMLVFLERVQSQ